MSQNRPALTIVANHPYEGTGNGTQRFLKEIAPRLSKKFEVSLLLYDQNNSKAVSEKETDSLKIDRFHSLFSLIGRLSIAKQEISRIKKIISKSDLVFIQDLDCIFPLYFAYKMKKRVVIYFHGVDWEVFPRALKLPFFLEKILSPFIKGYVRFWHQRTDQIFIPSTKFEKTLRNIGVKTPCFSLPLGIDHDQFPPSQDKNLAKKQIGISSSATVIGYVGRISPEKNISFLIQLFYRLQKEFSNLKLLLVGPGFETIQNEIKDPSKILCVGQQEDVSPYLQAMDIFCMPSKSETTSLVCMEAMCSGLPVVAYDTGSLGEYLFHEKNGFLVSLENESEFIEKVHILIQDKTVREALGTEARKTILKRQSWDEMTEKMTVQFSEILERKS